ncbi:MAG: D-inositol-3-phosphate glycosyltransferase, partial [Actinobacteria bacterium]|nr:D-inositol-3-phosphate glycosyltransferase [Actinomycetota bacterium]
MAATPAQRVAVLSLHTSPLAQPGVGDGGGMNVYVRELTSSLARLGVECTTYTRAWKPGLPEVVDIEPNHRLVHV